MRVVDTSAWIEWLAGSLTGRSLTGLFPTPEFHVVPTIVQLELAIWAGREVSLAYADRVISRTRILIVAQLDTSIALRAAGLRREHKLSTADAIIYATALANDADLLTCDKHFEGLPHVIYTPKLLA